MKYLGWSSWWLRNGHYSWCASFRTWLFRVWHYAVPYNDGKSIEFIRLFGFEFAIDGDKYERLHGDNK